MLLWRAAMSASTVFSNLSCCIVPSLLPPYPFVHDLYQLVQRSFFHWNFVPFKKIVFQTALSCGVSHFPIEHVSGAFDADRSTRHSIPSGEELRHELLGLVVALPFDIRQVLHVDDLEDILINL